MSPAANGRARQGKTVFLDQVEDGDAALMLGIRARRAEGLVVNADGYQAVVTHCPHSGSCGSRSSAHGLAGLRPLRDASPPGPAQQSLQR